MRIRSIEAAERSYQRPSKKTAAVQAFCKISCKQKEIGPRGHEF